MEIQNFIQLNIPIYHYQIESREGESCEKNERLYFWVRVFMNFQVFLPVLCVEFHELFTHALSAKNKIQWELFE